MSSRYLVRITRFNDRKAYQRVVDFLAGLYPDRERDDFEVGLARLPCTLSHDAAESAAEELKSSLVRRGANVLLIPVKVAAAAAAARPVASTQELSPEIDLSFLDKTRKPKKKPAPADPRSRRTGPTESGKAPWE